MGTKTSQFCNACSNDDDVVESSIDWSINNIFSATSQHRRFYSFSQGPPTLSYVIDRILNVEELWREEKFNVNEDSSMDMVRRAFQDAIRTNDAAYLFRAYTIESSFYPTLNKTLASHNELTNEERENPPWFCAFARFLASDEPTLRPYRWTGTAYRGVPVSTYHSAQLQVGKMLMNKAFLSSSKSRDIAIHFVGRGTAKNTRGTVLKCVVNDDRAAFDISTMSAYPDEEEVLILPCMDFQITEIEEYDSFLEITLLLR